MSNENDLESRVIAYKTMTLPGQPASMHMGTNHLVNDLWIEVQRLREELKEAYSPESRNDHDL